MLRIRLARTGKKKQASYRVVIADKKRAVQAKFVEILGWYNPHTKELNINKEKTEGWLKKGASPSNSVAKLLKKEKFELPKWVNIIEKKKQKKARDKKAEKPAPAASGAVKEEVKGEEAEGKEEAAKHAKLSEESSAGKPEQTPEESSAGQEDTSK